MKNKLFILLAALFAVFAFTDSAFAQSSYGTVPLLTGGTNDVAADTTKSYTGKLVSTKLADDVTFYVSAAGVGATTDTATFVFDKSIDGVNFPTTAGNRFSIVLTLAGTTPQSIVTNLALGSVGYVRLREITTTTDVNLTNVTVTAAVKQKAR